MFLSCAKVRDYCKKNWHFSLNCLIVMSHAQFQKSSISYPKLDSLIISETNEKDAFVIYVIAVFIFRVIFSMCQLTTDKFHTTIQQLN